jgi:hypothetical protein
MLADRRWIRLLSVNRNHQASGGFVTLGSCRFLDGLVVEESVEARKKIVRSFGFLVVRGIVVTSSER